MSSTRQLFDRWEAARATLKATDNEAKAAMEKEARLKEKAADPPNASNASVQDEAKAATVASLQAQLAAKDAELVTNRLEKELDFLDGRKTTFLDAVKTAFADSWTWLLIGAACLVGYILYSVTNSNATLSTLLDGGAKTRGLLTFLLAASTVGISFMLVYQAFQPRSGPENFRFAREVFGSLIAVLGTIVGFYFGAASKDESQKSEERNLAGQDAANLTPPDQPNLRLHSGKGAIGEAEGTPEEAKGTGQQARNGQATAPTPESPPATPPPVSPPSGESTQQ